MVEFLKKILDGFIIRPTLFIINIFLFILRLICGSQFHFRIVRNSIYPKRINNLPYHIALMRTLYKNNVYSGYRECVRIGQRYNDDYWSSFNDRRFFYVRGWTKVVESEWSSKAFPCYVHGFAPKLDKDISCLWCTKTKLFSSIQEYNEYMEKYNKLKVMW